MCLLCLCGVCRPLDAWDIIALGAVLSTFRRASPVIQVYGASVYLRARPPSGTVSGQLATAPTWCALRVGGGALASIDGGPRRTGRLFVTLTRGACGFFRGKITQALRAGDRLWSGVRPRPRALSELRGRAARRQFTIAGAGTRACLSASSASSSGRPLVSGTTRQTKSSAAALTSA